MESIRVEWCRPFDVYVCVSTHSAMGWFGPSLTQHTHTYIRIYSPKEMQAMVETIPGHEGYEWEYGLRPWSGAKSVPLFIPSAPYLIGIPKAGSKKDN